MWYYISEGKKVSSGDDIMYRKYIKRILDVFFALLLLILLLPIFVIIAILIKIDSKGPVLFHQERTGYKGKNFNLCKFRSMAVSNDVHDFKTEDKHTKIGKILRKTSLDELPQLINVLKGEMSFIGPRPWITDYYENMTKKQRKRVDVKPGITGLAQANGRNGITIKQKINYDLEYVKNCSFKEDIKIIFLTVKAIFSCKGADAGKSTIHDELEELKKQKDKK